MLKTTSVPKADAQGEPVRNPDGSQVMENVPERVRGEFWLANGHEGIESEMFVYPCICQPASGPFAERQQSLCVKFTPSAELAELMHAEMMAAIENATK